MRRHIGKAIITLVNTLLLCSALRAADEPFRVDYTVEIANIEEHEFRVVADVSNVHQDSVEFSLPVWTPGWYTLEEYARNISRFVIRGPDGKRLNHERTHKQSWRVETNGLSHVTVEFNYKATQFALNQAKIDSDYAFFTGTELFVMAEGHRDCPSKLRLKCPAEWQAVSALKETDDPFVFSAANYDELVDGPVLMGKFDARKFDALGKPHWLVTLPKGKFQDARATELTGRLAKIVGEGGKLFGGLPYDKYVFFYFFKRSETRASGGLEHANSHVCFFPQGEATSLNAFEWMASHEYFHVWNVKRIRPVQLWPYDYSHESETPLLWVSEGFTTYYGSVLLYRAGLSPREEFFSAAAGSIAQVESAPAHDFMSPSESSMATWLSYDRHMSFEVSYYLSGRNLATLLDLSILHDTKGKRGLDDVMRALYADFYLKNKGFDQRGLLDTIRKIGGRDYTDFFKKHVDGVERPPYEEIFGYAGLKIEFSKLRDGFGNVAATISELPDATSEQKTIRDAWLRK